MELLLTVSWVWDLEKFLSQVFLQKPGILGTPFLYVSMKMILGGYFLVTRGLLANKLLHFCLWTGKSK